MSDDELIGDLRYKVLNIPPLREPHTAGYYSQMAKGMIEEIERVPPGELKEYIRPKKKAPLKGVRRLVQWTMDFPDEFKIFLIGVGVGIVFMMLVGLILYF